MTSAGSSPLSPATQKITNPKEVISSKGAETRLVMRNASAPFSSSRRQSALRRAQLTNVRECLSKPRPELRIPSAAAQTRTVSAGKFWPSQWELSQYLKYMARTRIPEFESSHPSQAVVSTVSQEAAKIAVSVSGLCAGVFSTARSGLPAPTECTPQRCCVTGLSWASSLPFLYSWGMSELFARRVISRSIRQKKSARTAGEPESFERLSE